jgi:DNA polymerase III subunit delta'
MPSPLSSSSDPLTSRPVRVMLEALRKNRLSHSLIISGEEQDAVELTAHHVAGQILNGVDSPLLVTRHPDFFTLRPTGKMRQISAGSTRELIRSLNHSSREGGGKVAILYDADRMHISSANIFLKTLEEPPAGTTILLLTARPHFLLPTIKSRCLHFRLPTLGLAKDFPAALDGWLSDYSSWLESMAGQLTSKQQISRQVIGLYGLLSRFSPLLKSAIAESWKAQKVDLPENITEEEEQALAEGMRLALRDQVFTALEHRLRNFAAPRLREEGAGQAFAQTVAELERTARLLRVNLQESAALEGFLLAALRHWGRRRAA